MVTPIQALAATLSLVPSTGTANRGCSFAVNIELDTAGVATDGTDAILKYEPSKLTAVSPIVSGTIYPDYAGNNIDATTGNITVSGLASVSEAFTGKGTLATINFTVPANAPTGVTTVRFDFDPNNKSKTTDSNVVQRGTIADVLSSVVDGSFTIGTGTCAQQTLTTTPGTSGGTTGSGLSGRQGATGTGSGQLQTIDDAVGGSTGTTELTYTVAIVGAALTILGILGLVLL